MQIEDVTKLPEVNGTKKQKERAQTAFNIFRLRGAFYPDSSPIRIALPELSQYIREFEGGSKDITNALIAALEANPDVFWKEEIGDEIFFGTTRVGTSTFGDVSPEVDSHSLQARFATPEPPRPRPISRHDEIPELDSLLDASIGESANLYPADSWQAAVAAALADADSAETGTISLSGEQVDSVELELDPPIEVDEHEELVVEMETDTAVLAEELILEETVTEEVVVAEEIVAEADILNITEASVDEVAESIVNLLENEPEIVRWGQHWMAEPAIPRLSRGDLRKTQEFIVSSDKPLTDAELVSDLRGIHRNDDVFETERFGLNYRLSRETNDFEFVGTANQGLWTVPGQLEPVTAPARKINEIGQDYRYLSDYPSPDEDLEVGIIEHVLSYYEYVNGVLPLDANTATLMPESAYSEQRATRITFENPLTHETFSAELRYPTGNRGGFIYGLAEFFEENMVPGAVITLESTDVETHLRIS